MDPVTVALKQQGVSEVRAALRSVQDAITALDSHAANSAKRSGRDRVQSIKAEASERRKSSGNGGSNAQRQTAFTRALGGNSSSAMRRASSGPTVGEYAGLASSSVGSLMGTVAKFGAVGGAIALFKSSIDLAGAALTQFGGFLISDVIKPAFALETQAQQLENSTGGKFKKDDVVSTSRAQGLRHNVSPEAALESVKKLIDEGFGGDIEAAKAVNDAVLTISKSRGIDPRALAGFAASIKGTFKTASAETVSKLLATQIAQGDEGSVTIEQLSQLGGRIVAPASLLAGDDDSRLAQVGALMQATRSGFGSADENATGVGNLINHFATTTDALQKKMFQVQEGKDKGKVLDLGNVMANIYKLTGGDPSKVVSKLKIGASSPEMKAILSQLETYKSAGGGKAGEEAVASNIKGFQEMSSSLEAERDGERKVLQTSGEKWSAAIEGIKNKMLDIMPEVQKLVDSLSQKGPAIASAVTSIAKALVALAAWINDWFGDNDAAQKDITTLDSATGEETTIKQYEIDERARSDAFNPSAYQGGDLTAEEFDAAAAREKAAAEGVPSVLDPLLAPPASPAVMPSFTSEQSSSAPTATSAAPNAALDQLDALGPKISSVSIMFDKLTASGNDLSRTTSLGKR